MPGVCWGGFIGAVPYTALLPEAAGGAAPERGALVLCAGLRPRPDAAPEAPWRWCSGDAVPGCVSESFPALSSARALRASQRSCWDVPKAMSGGPGPRQLTCGGLCKAKVFVALGWYQLGGVRCSDLRAGGSHSADRISLLRAAPRHCSRITRVWV